MYVMEWSLYCSPWWDLHLEWCTWLIGKNKKPKDDICSSCFLCFQLHILGNFGSMTWMERRLWSCALSNLIADGLERVEFVSGMHQNSPQINFGNSLTLAPPAFSWHWADSEGQWLSPQELQGLQQPHLFGGNTCLYEGHTR